MINMLSNHHWKHTACWHNFLSTKMTWLLPFLSVFFLLFLIFKLDRLEMTCTHVLTWSDNWYFADFTLHFLSESSRLSRQILWSASEKFKDKILNKVLVFGFAWNFAYGFCKIESKYFKKSFLVLIMPFEVCKHVSNEFCLSRQVWYTFNNLSRVEPNIGHVMSTNMEEVELVTFCARRGSRGSAKGAMADPVVGRCPYW